MSFGYFSVGFGASSGVAPLAVSLSSQSNLTILGNPPSSSGTTAAGDIDVTATASGGSGSYTYAWVLSEERDDTNDFTINTQGTANVAQYDDSRVNWAMAGSPPFGHGFYRVTCTVSDGASTPVAAQEDFEIILG